MLTNEIIADLQERISLARLMSEENIKVDVKTLSLLLDFVTANKNVLSTETVDLNTALENIKNANKIA